MIARYILHAPDMYEKLVVIAGGAILQGLAVLPSGQPVLLPRNVGVGESVQLDVDLIVCAKVLVCG